ncbi:MAG: hypothetical protein HOG51_11045, partial [Gammaproteobacteria bacterium]|nr:hypothetical protein [Gammaproteobacteria bacterium]
MKKLTISLILLFATAVSTLQLVYSQSGTNNSGSYSQDLLNTKRVFSQGLADAIGQPFRGVATSAGVMDGLFPIRSTGVSTAAIKSAADTFLDT